MNIDFLTEKMESISGQIALITESKKITYGDLLDEYKIAMDFLQSCGVKDSSVVAIIGEFSLKNIALMLALIQKSCIYVPLSLAVKNKEKCLKIAEVEFCIENGVVKKISDIAPTHPLLKSLIDSKNPGLILFSSGSTGEPKAALHNLTPMLEKYKADTKPWRSIAFLLFDHIGGFHTLMYSLASGGLLVTLKERNADEVAQNIQQYKIELLPTSPSFLNIMLLSSVCEKYDLSSLKVITYGTEPMPETTLKKINEALPNVKLKQTYGLSELGIMRTKSESSTSLWLKIGGDENHSVKIIDGVLYIRSKMAMLGYLNAPSPFDDEGYMNTKDKVEVRGEFFKILGRESEIINVGGEKVFPQEVENVLLEIPGVKDAVVFGMPNALLGNVVACKVAVNDGTNTRELKTEILKHCTKRLDKFKRPVKVEFETKEFASSRFKKMRK